MRRRTLLRRSAAAGALALAGCISNANDDTGNTDTPADDGDPTENGGPATGGGTTPTPDGGNGDDATGTDTPLPSPPEVDETSIETRGANCASGNTGTATVGFDPSANRVSVEGVLRAANPCHLASLESATYDPDTTVLEVVVTAKDDPDAGMCTQCIAAVDYVATVDMEGDLPGTVAVIHGTGEEATEVVRVALDGGA